MSQVNPNIFKAYDIRGLYPDDLDQGLAYKVGRAYATLIKKENPGRKLEIVVSRDMRQSSPALKKKLVAGLTDSGLDVIDIGLNTTTTFYFAVGYYGYDGGIQITASHNPKEYNGFKLTRAQAKPISGETGIMEIKDMVIAEEFCALAEQTGTIKTKQGVRTDLIAEQTQGINLKQIKPFTVVADAANSVAALDLEALFQQLDAKLIKLNFELDGTFPSHPADPLKEENLELIKQKVVEAGADFGIAPDGDGDRYFFIDEQGHTIRQEILRGIMAQITLKKHPGATICYDIRPGRITRDMIEQAGGEPVVTRVGHSLIKQKMLEVDAAYGGESSGHYFYRFDYGTFEAPVKLTVEFLRFISQQGKPLSEIIKPYQKYYHSGEINSEVEDKQTVLERLADKYADADISRLDGVTITYDDFWFNVRPSNTEPKLRLNLEATSPSLMAEKRDEVLAVIRQ
jgi:phosphomannomutase